MRYLFFQSAAVLLLLAVSCSREHEMETIPSSDSFEYSSEYGKEAGHLRVKFNKEVSDTKAGGIDLSALGHYTMTRTFPPAGKWEERHRRAGLHLWYDIFIDDSIPLTKASAELSSLPEISIVEFVPEIKPAELTYPFNDPRLPEQWHYQNPGGRTQWAEGCDINAFKAWEIETGKPQVIVAINDNGVDYAHEDLAANMWINEAEFYGKPGEDDDNNGYPDDIYGYSFVTYDKQTPVGKIEPLDHGTHVAGTVAAVNNNGIGVCGVAGGDGTPGSGARIMCTQMMDGRSSAFVAASMVYAADNGAVLMNCSWHNVNYEQETDSSTAAAIDYFNENAGIGLDGEQTGPMAGGLVIFAAGNDGVEVSHPAMDDNVFAVAALSANYVRSYYTSFGTWVDICAPGGDAIRKTYVLSTVPDNMYDTMQGSSMAAPHVTGVAALLVSHYGVGRKGFTREKLIYLLQSTANKIALIENGSYATRLGAGLVDAYAALTVPMSEKQPEAVKKYSLEAKSNFLTVNITVPDPVEGEGPYAFHVFYSKKSLDKLDPAKPGKDVGHIYLTCPGKASGDTVSKVISELEFNTDYHFRICSENFMNVLSPLSEEKTVKTGKNTKPVVTPLDGVSIELASHARGSLRFQLSDPDGHPVSAELKELLPGLAFSREDDIVTLSINALSTDAGQTYNGILSVSDGYGVTEQPFSYNVLKNNPPVLKGEIPDQIYTSTNEIRTFNLSDYFTDPDGENLKYTVERSTTSLIVEASVNNGELTVKGNSYGLTGLTVTAMDARRAKAELSFRILVRDAASTFDLYPNPVTDNLNVRAGEYLTADIRITNRAGAVVYEQTGAELNPFDLVVINMKSLPGGIYYVRIGDHKFTVAKQ